MAESEEKRGADRAIRFILFFICVLFIFTFEFLGGRSSAPPVALPQPAKTHGNDINQLKHWADKTAAPLLDELEKRPNSSELLIRIGNTYCDASQFATCIQYYERAVKLVPNNADVRTDLANAYYYSGDTDRAIDALNRSLQVDPRHANALFNLGMIKLQGKHDNAGAAETWETLLREHPDFPLRNHVQKLIAQAKHQRPYTSPK